MCAGAVPGGGSYTNNVPENSTQFWHYLDFPVAQTVKNPPERQEARVQSLGWEVPLEKGMAIHCSILAWRIPWTEKPGGLQSMRLQRVGHDWVTNTVHTVWHYLPRDSIRFHRLRAQSHNTVPTSPLPTHTHTHTHTHTRHQLCLQPLWPTGYIHTLIYIYKIDNENLLYITGSSIQYFGIVCIEKNLKKTGYIYIYNWFTWLCTWN